MKPLVITLGEPGGVGAELCLHLLADDDLPPLVVLGDGDLLKARAAQFGMLHAVAGAADYERMAGDAGDVPHAPHAPHARHAVWHLPAAQAVAAGEVSPANAGYVLAQLRQAAAGCLDGRFSAMVTAPISKAAILAAGEDFIGQTEFLAACAGTTAAAPTVHPVMLLAAPGTESPLRVALATTHLPLREVADAISEASLLSTLTVLHEALPRYFPTAAPPRIKVCGLNPHSGEGGRLGDEEQRVILPAVRAAQARGMDVRGPFSADTLLAMACAPRAAGADCILAMYHDQGLPVAKARDFARTINITLGLPFLRTSPDHGVAQDIAAAGGASPVSMLAAARFAARAASA